MIDDRCPKSLPVALCVTGAALEFLENHIRMEQYHAELAKLNKDIRYYGETTDPGVTPKERREEIRDAQRDKNDLLEDIYEIRRDAGF